jgi:hypothetical protein
VLRGGIVVDFYESEPSRLIADTVTKNIHAVHVNSSLLKEGL